MAGLFHGRALKLFPWVCRLKSSAAHQSCQTMLSSDSSIVKRYFSLIYLNPSLLWNSLQEESSVKWKDMESLFCRPSNAIIYLSRISNEATDSTNHRTRPEKGMARTGLWRLMLPFWEYFYSPSSCLPCSTS